MIPFLQSVAIELTARYGSDVRKFEIVVPHKRGVTYLRKYFEEAIKDELHREATRRELPRIVTIAEHVEGITGLKHGKRLELLFTLYDTHRSLYEEDKAPTAESFEDFRRWGETALSDFNDVDMYDVDADALFKNLVAHNEIRTDYLTEVQKEVIEKYFGVVNPGGHISRFWGHLNGASEVQREFLNLWEKLGPLYHGLRERLYAKKTGYPGMLFRRACELVESGDYKFRASRVAYVGFNALSTTERRLFKAVKRVQSPWGGSLADYFWDAPGPALSADSPVDAGRFLRKNAKEFACSIPEMSKYSSPTTFPEVVQEISCPGNTAQAKVITSVLNTVVRGHGQPYVDPARVAVVLPDEGLLFPVFHSVPSEITDKVNLTMGFPLRLTSVSSFIGLLRQMHARSRSSRAGCRYFGKDVSALLAHPIVRSLTGQELANRLQGYIIETHLYFVGLEELLAVPEVKTSERREWLETLFGALPGGDDPKATAGHVTGILAMVKEALSEKTGGGESVMAGSGISLESSHIEHFMETIGEFGAACEEYGIRMPPKTALTLACRLLAHDKVQMQGQALEGLQIMGMLETRALDFDYLIIPSMNERVFPRKLRAKTFIPEALRLGYGIATTRFQEEIFAYHFYRLIARAKEVYLLYDASQGGLKSGDPSRYLLQLRYLFGEKRRPQQVSARFRLATGTGLKNMSVAKTGAAADALAAYLNGSSGKRLSASSLKEYLACPLKFYFSYILNKKVDEEPTEFMSAIMIGNVLHETMQYLYDSLKPSVERAATVSEATVQGWLDGGPAGAYACVRDVAAHFVRKNYLSTESDDVELPGDAVIMLDMLERQVRWCLEADKRLAPFEYLASELKVPSVYMLKDGRTVNMTMIIDRLDRVTAPDGSKRLRIVDYKTGSDNTGFKKMDELFASDGKHKAIFQLMLYAQLLSYNKPKLTGGQPIALSIYKSRELYVSDYVTSVSHEGRAVYSHLPFMNDFNTQLDERLSELFDTTIDFAPGEGMPDGSDYSQKPCKYCPYKSLCLS